MDKVLSFSILSASLADVASGAGAGGSWARVSWRGRKLQEDDRAGAAGKQGKQGGLPVESEQQPGNVKSQSPLPRFAPEFDGIDCFETIVWH
ncbi:uncharacterized protein [Aegilops tauschii subsp. strangulata]|uniref:Uncharacterized protein n=1 Tax=Aegilops tauschii subsp. strangulata TaxID=200361 RepID=A0A453QJC5_AEGTS|nr:uncharacterized protein LOC120969747 [Aegilops tauschii subsp. strangulata]